VSKDNRFISFSSLLERVKVKPYRKLHVLHIIPNLGTGGAERLVVNLVKSFDKDRFDVAVCILYPKSGTTFEKHLEKSEIPIYYLGKHKGLDLRMIPRLYRLFQDFKPLSVQRYALIPLILCRIPARFHTVHSIAQKEVDAPGKIVHRLAFHMGGVIPVSISQEVARTVEKLYKVRTPIIYNGIPTKHFQSTEEARSIWRKKEGIKSSEVVFLHIGSFSPQKNHRLLVEAFAQATKKRSDLKLLLVGDGELRPDIEKIVREKRLEQNIHFLGLRQDISELLSACDIFILSSNYEGVPMTILEAMAAGKPVIATAVGGVPEVVKDGISGLLVPPQDIQALSNAMVRLADDSSLREGMGKEGRKRALEWFDINLIVRQYEELYLKVLGDKLQ